MPPAPRCEPARVRSMEQCPEQRGRCAAASQLPLAVRTHSMHCPGIGSSCSQIDRGRRMTVNAAFRSCAR
eukprot:COSAG06_NODE_6983_length_2687_cov_5.125966_3_plen_69_part_01